MDRWMDAKEERELKKAGYQYRLYIRNLYLADLHQDTDDNDMYLVMEDDAQK